MRIDGPFRWLAHWALAISLSAGSWTGTDALAQPLPTDERLVTGRLDNGLAYVVLRHANPPGRVTFWLHVSTGSLNESDRQRGVAHFLEHMAFNGSANFPPGSVVPYFESLGLTFGRHQNAMTGFDQTIYQLALPSTEAATIDRGLVFLSDVAFRLTLPEGEIEAEREVILEEKRTRAGAMQRVSDELLPRIAPGSLIGRRLPIGTEESIRTMTREDFQSYYDRYYAASNMTLIAVGDLPEEAVVGAVRAHFSGGPARPRPADADPLVTTPASRAAAVITDPELAEAEVALYMVGLWRPPPATEDELKDELTLRIASQCFSRRTRALVESGSASFRGASAGASNFAGAVRWAVASASGAPDRWRDILAELATELQRARLHGFSAAEVEAVVAQMISGADQAAREEPTLPAQARIRGLAQAIGSGAPLMSADQEARLVRRLAPTITAEAVSARFAAELNPRAALVVLQAPTSVAVPDDAGLLALASAALAVEPPPPADTARAASILDRDPAPGDLVELSHHPATGVSSAWLSNNVRVHHRGMTDRRGMVLVSISLAGGQAIEPADRRGATEAAAIAWGRAPATRSRPSTQVRELLAPIQVDVSGRHTLTTLRLSISAAPADLEEAFRLAHALLTDPLVESPAFDQWRDQQLRLLAANRREPTGMFKIALWDAMLTPGETRGKPLTEAALEALTAATAQGTLDEAVGSWPIEAAIVGDVERERAFELARVYLGSLPARARPSPGPAGEIPPPAGPRTDDVTVRTRTDQAVVFVGFGSCDESDRDDRAALAVAARVLSTRLVAEVREQKRLVYSVSASHAPGGTAACFPGYGFFSAGALTDAARADELAATLETAFDRFAAEGPTDDEVAVALRQLANTHDEQTREPGYWAARLSDLAVQGSSLDDLADDAAAVQRVTRERVVETFRRYRTPDRAIRVIVRPSLPEAEEPPTR